MLGVPVEMAIKANVAAGLTAMPRLPVRIVPVVLQVLKLFEALTLQVETVVAPLLVTKALLNEVSKATPLAAAAVAVLPATTVRAPADVV